MRGVFLLLPVSYIESLDRLVEEKKYPSRAAVIRMAIRDLLRDELWLKTESSEHDQDRF